MGTGHRILGRFALPLLASLVAPVALVGTGGCTNQTSDSNGDSGAPTALGSGDRIRQVMNPADPAHGNNGGTVTITGATYLFVDSFDETNDGKSIGTVYLQDVPPSGSPPPPFSGAALYKPTYIPTNLVPAPGDVLDLVGIFSVSAKLGAATLTPPSTLIQIDTPILQPRFEYELPPPRVIDVNDLDEQSPLSPSAYAVGQQWVGMLVTIQNVTLTGPLVVDSAGRATAQLTADTANGPTISNENFDVGAWNSSISPNPLQQGAHLASVTGIVTWFFSYHIAPRTPADIVLASPGAGDGGT